MSPITVCNKRLSVTDDCPPLLTSLTMITVCVPSVINCVCGIKLSVQSVQCLPCNWAVLGGKAVTVRGQKRLPTTNQTTTDQRTSLPYLVTKTYYLHICRAFQKRYRLFFANFLAFKTSTTQPLQNPKTAIFLSQDCEIREYIDNKHKICTQLRKINKVKQIETNVKDPFKSLEFIRNPLKSLEILP